jgi:hypothetical protein
MNAFLCLIAFRCLVTCECYAGFSRLKSCTYFDRWLDLDSALKSLRLCAEFQFGMGAPASVCVLISLALIEFIRVSNDSLVFVCVGGVRCHSAG